MSKFPRWSNLSELLPEKIEIFLKENFEREPLLREIESFAEKHKVPILLPSAACVLRFVVSILKPKKILEIGTGIGYSTLNMLYSLHGECEVITVDINKKRLDIANGFFLRSGFSVKTINDDGLSYMRKLLSEGELFDFIFIDCTKGEYPFFNYKVQALLRDGGAAAFDNVLFRGYIFDEVFSEKYKRTVNILRTFLNQVKSYPNLSFCLFPVGDGILFIKQKTLKDKLT